MIRWIMSLFGNWKLEKKAKEEAAQNQMFAAEQEKKGAINQLEEAVRNVAIRAAEHAWRNERSRSAANDAERKLRRL